MSDVMSDVVVDELAHETASSNVTVPAETTKRRASYDLEVFGDQLPASDTGHHGPGPSGLFLNLLAVAEDADKHGQWVGVATYETTNGATGAANRVRKGQTQIPSVPGTWEFRVLRKRVDGRIISKLLAKFVPGGAEDGVSIVAAPERPGRGGAANSVPNTPLAEDSPPRKTASRGRGKAAATA